MAVCNHRVAPVAAPSAQCGIAEAVERAAHHARAELRGRNVDVLGRGKDGDGGSSAQLPQAQHTRQQRQQHDAAGRPSVAVFKRRARGQAQQSIRALRVCQSQFAAMVI